MLKMLSNHVSCFNIAIQCPYHCLKEGHNTMVSGYYAVDHVLISSGAPHVDIQH